MANLTKQDMHYVLTRIPKDVVAMLRCDPRLCIAGGIIRALIGQEKPNDIDVFGPSLDVLKGSAEKLANDRTARGEQSKVHKTDNALTVFTPNRLPVQFITRWTYTDMQKVVESFDFTVCQGAIFFDPKTKLFDSNCAEAFYSDLAARRLTYTSPQRNEDAGGSLLRVIKYVRRGYSIQVISLGHVCARLYSGIRPDSEAVHDEARRGLVLAGLLREVDPMLMVDGIEVADDDQHNVERIA